MFALCYIASEKWSQVFVLTDGRKSTRREGWEWKLTCFISNEYASRFSEFTLCFSLPAWILIFTALFNKIPPPSLFCVLPFLFQTSHYCDPLFQTNNPIAFFYCIPKIITCSLSSLYFNRLCRTTPNSYQILEVISSYLSNTSHHSGTLAFSWKRRYLY